MAAKKQVAASAAPPEQLEMELPLSDQYQILLQAEQIRLACERYCEDHKYKVVADELDAIFGKSLGHPVSASTLRAAIDGTERNYWRGEWLPYFARRCPEVAALLATAAPAPLTAEQVLEVLDRVGPVVLGSSYSQLRSKIGGGK